MLLPRKAHLSSREILLRALSGQRLSAHLSCLTSPQKKVPSEQDRGAGSLVSPGMAE